jgi:hypothetical protein
MQKDEARREQMFKMINMWQQSGLTQKAYCKKHGIAYHVFHWYKRFRDRQAASKNQGFIALKIQPSDAA